MENAPTQPGLAPGFFIRAAVAADVPAILGFIRALADYEKLLHEVTATEDLLREQLFGPTPRAEVVLAELDGRPIGFALFFHNFSTFLAKPGIHLEDLFVLPEFRGRGFGKALLVHVGKLAKARGCGRYEWAVLDWNEPSIRFYRALGAQPMADWTVMRVTGDALDRLAAFA
jgi:GNAT superfamily N-acetyltransferase